MPDYNTAHFDPPAPVAVVIMRAHKGAARFENVTMLLDTGSDVSLVPKAFVDRLGVEYVPSYRRILEGFNGTILQAPVVQVELVFEGKFFRGRYPVIDQEVGILGRNVLNSLPLLLDGPNQNWRIAT